MKNSMKAGLVLAVVAAGILFNTWAADSTAAIRKGKYEYWVWNGQASSVRSPMEKKLNEGFEIDRLETNPMPTGYSECYVFIVLKRERID